MFFDASLVLNQLTQSSIAGAGRLKCIIGASNFVYSKKDSFVQFKFMCGAKNNANNIRITLNNKNLYDVEFFTIRKLDEKNVKGVFNDVHADMLFDLFEKETDICLTV